MTIPVQQSLAGFIASDADVSFTDAGITRVHFRAGVEHWRRVQDGTFTKLDNSFHDLLIFGKTAERAAARFRKGDQFVAHGYVDTRPAEPPARPSEVFVARKIGHDLARTAYEVNRTPATARQDPHHLEQAAVGATAPPSHDAQRAPATPPAGAMHPTAPRSGTSPGAGIGLGWWTARCPGSSIPSRATVSESASLTGSSQSSRTDSPMASTASAARVIGTARSSPSTGGH